MSVKLCLRVAFCSPLLPPAYVVRREGNVLTRVCPSICLSTRGGGTHIPQCFATFPRMPWGSRGGVPWPGGYPGWGGYPGRGGYPGWGGYLAGGGYPVRTTLGVLATRLAVCLLRSRRRTFLFTLFKNGFKAFLWYCLHIMLKRSKLPLTKTV